MRLKSDQGSPDRAYDYLTLFKANGITQSRRRKGDCHDKAVGKRFFKTLKTERVTQRTDQTSAEANASLFEYIEVFYNQIRRRSTINHQSPYEFEPLVHQQNTLAYNKILRLKLWLGIRVKLGLCPQKKED